MIDRLTRFKTAIQKLTRFTPTVETFAGFVPRSLRNHILKSSALGKFYAETRTSDGRPRPSFNQIAATDTRDVETYIGLAVKVIGGAVSRLPMDVGFWETNDDGDLIFSKDNDSDLGRLMRNINPWFSRRELDNWIIQSILLAGDGYLEKVRNGAGRVIEIWPLVAFHMEKIIDTTTGAITAYEYKVRGHTQNFPPEDIIEFRQINICNPYHGHTMIQALQKTILANLHLRTLQSNFLANDATPSGILTTDSRKMNLEIKDEIKREWNATYGGPNNTGRIALLHNGVKFETVMQEFGKLGLKEIYNINRDEILGAYHVPPIMAGVFEFANYANAREQIKIFWQFREEERANLEEGYSRGLGPEFNGEEFRKDLSGVDALKADRKEAAETATSLVSGGIITVNEARSKWLDGLKPIDEDGADELRQITSTPMQLSPIAQTVDDSGDKSLDLTQTNGNVNGNRNGHKCNEFRAPDLAIASNCPVHKGTVTRRDRRQYIAFLEGETKRNRREFMELFRRQRDRILGHLETIEGRASLAIELMRVEPTARVGARKQNEVFDFFMIMDVTIENLDYQNTVGRVTSQTVQNAGSRAIASIGLDQAFDFDDMRVQTIIERTKNLSTRMSNTTFASVRDLLKTAVQERQTPRQFAAEIRKLFDNWTGTSVVGFQKAEPRSLRIARTETQRLVQAATQQGYLQSSVVGFKEWATILDGRERLEHALADGEVVRIGEPFRLTGEDLQFPGDSAGSAGNTINCRCMSGAIVDPELLAEFLESERLTTVSQ